ncbi:hypothetical protein chiPu_0015767 [Chiloscyllium punctatum]|uniref:Uncharacterized protein n=1 Tax=Chiloscyllium punctatum TaxID=137246 RepID=A0A401T3P7_CHIPU|nr:hypothetical protein [Chiloscyllium punctatum]
MAIEARALPLHTCRTRCNQAWPPEPETVTVRGVTGGADLTGGPDDQSGEGAAAAARSGHGAPVTWARLGDARRFHGDESRLGPAGSRRSGAVAGSE